MKSALISIKPQYIDTIIKGLKTVEIRKKAVLMEPGTQLWLYATRPYFKIVALSTVKAIDRGHPKTIWKKFSRETGISHETFSKYADESEIITAISINNLRVLEQPITLDEIKRTIPAFHPPQFYQYIKPDTPLHKLLQPSISSLL